MKSWLGIVIILIIVSSIAGIIWSQWRIRQYNDISNPDQKVEKK